MKKQIPVWKAAAFAAAAVILAVAVTLFFVLDLQTLLFHNGSVKLGLYQKISQLYDTIEENSLYEIDEQDLLDYMSAGLVAGTKDKYGRYYNEESLTARKNSDKSVVAGIGVTSSVNSETHAIRIHSVYDNSPAAAAELQAGDEITAVDGTALADVAEEDVTNTLRGEIGTEVQITVQRGEETFERTLTRAEVTIPSIQSRMIGTKGYISILDFAEPTAADFKEAVDSLIAQGADGLIFDLRNDGGGLLDAVTEMLDYLLPEGTIYTTTDRDGNELSSYTSDASEIDLPMITLTNGETASASELFVMALKDYGKAPSVGTKTYGKGIMQNTYFFQDQTGLKLTTAYFNPPKSENFNGKGIEPDYLVELTEEQSAVFSTLDETNDPQLQKALEVLGG